MVETVSRVSRPTPVKAISSSPLAACVDREYRAKPASWSVTLSVVCRRLMTPTRFDVCQCCVQAPRGYGNFSDRLAGAVVTIGVLLRQTRA